MNLSFYHFIHCTKNLTKLTKKKVTIQWSDIKLHVYLDKDFVVAHTKKNPIKLSARIIIQRCDIDKILYEKKTMSIYMLEGILFIYLSFVFHLWYGINSLRNIKKSFFFFSSSLFFAVMVMNFFFFFYFFSHFHFFESGVIMCSVAAIILVMPRKRRIFFLVHSILHILCLSLMFKTRISLLCQCSHTFIVFCLFWMFILNIFFSLSNHLMNYKW